MPYRVEIGSVKVECESVEDVMRLMEAIRADPIAFASEVSGGGSGSGGGRQDAIPAAAQGESMSIRLLRSIHSAGRHGVLNSVLANGLGIGNPRGLGPVIVSLRNELARGASMNQDDAITVSRGQDGVRYYPTERTGEAIRKLVQMGGSS